MASAVDMWRNRLLCNGMFSKFLVFHLLTRVLLSLIGPSCVATGESLSFKELPMPVEEMVCNKTSFLLLSYSRLCSYANPPTCYHLVLFPALLRLASRYVHVLWFFFGWLIFDTHVCFSLCMLLFILVLMHCRRWFVRHVCYGLSWFEISMGKKPHSYSSLTRACVAMPTRPPVITWCCFPHPYESPSRYARFVNFRLSHFWHLSLFCSLS